MQAQDLQSESIRVLAESAAAVVPKAGDLTRIRRLRFTKPGFDRAIWRKMCNLGWPAICVPEDRGGAGLGAAALAALMIELGRGLVPEPLIACGISAALLDDVPLEDILAGRLVLPAWQDGANTLTTGGIAIRSGRVNGTKRFIPYAAGADAFLVIGEATAVIVKIDDPGVMLATDDTQDGGHFGTLTLENTPASEIALSPDRIAAALDQATLSTAAYLLGLSERAFEMTVDYLKTRHQFGRPIGSFQALQHRAVDLKLQLALARASVESVAALVDGHVSPADRAASVSRAKIRASQTALLVTRQAVQMHGAIAYTDEYDLGLFLRKAMVLAHLHGSHIVHKARYARTLLHEL